MQLRIDGIGDPAEAAARAADALECLLVRGVDSAMNEFN